MKRIRFTKKELDIIITAICMAGTDYEGHTAEDMTYEEAARVEESALHKLYILQKRLNKFKKEESL